MSKKSKIIMTKSTDQTIAVARRLGRHIPVGTVIAAYGELGMGKTCFAGGLARGMAIDDTVVSPTYIIFRLYPGVIPLAHIDAYRLEGLSEEEIAQTGIEDCFAPSNAVFVEWPGYISEWLPKSTVELHIGRGAADNDRLLEFIYDPEEQRWLDEAFSY